MKPMQTVLTIVFAIFLISVIVWIGGSGDKITTANSVPKPDSKSHQPELAPPKDGPFARAVANETTFDFGTIEKGDTGSHIFVIKNEGEGPLRVKKGATSCAQCTFGSVSREDDIPPGETVDVQVNWKISIPHGPFRHTADVYTNDPKNGKFEFAITGYIDTPVHTVPEGTWQLGAIPDNSPVVAEGVVFSPIVDDMKIERYECANPLVSITWEPMTESSLTEKKAKSGWKVIATVAAGTAVGPFRESVKLHTNVRGGTDVEFQLTGRRYGPLEIMGSGWNAGNNYLDLGEFPATEAKSKKVQMYVRNSDGDLQIRQLNAEGSRTQVRVAEKPRTQGKSKVYDIEVTVPAGPPSMRRYEEAEPIVLKLDHPDVQEFKFYVQYFAR